jgi:hypothetical protein
LLVETYVVHVTSWLIADALVENAADSIVAFAMIVATIGRGSHIPPFMPIVPFD